MITRVLVSGAIAVGAAVGLAAPAMADEPFTPVTTCTCEPPAQKDGSAAPSLEQMTRAIQQALSEIQASQPQP
jgi:hypothetical protein